MSVAQHEELEVSLAAVNAAQREMNREVLQPILTDLIVFGRVLKQLHWNVIGPHFRPIHLHLDEIYAEAEEAIDLVAERLAAVGHSPNGRLKDTLENAEIDDAPTGFIRDKEALILAEHRTKMVIDLIRSRMAQIEETDTVTADMLHQIVAGFEKHHWMIQAQRI